VKRNTKTYAIIYDITDVANPQLIRLSSIEGNISQTRMIGDTLYLLTNNFFNIPYHNFTTEEDISVNSKDFLPNKLDIVRSDSPR